MVLLKIVLILGCLVGIGFYIVFYLVNDVEKCFKVYVIMRNLKKKIFLEQEGKEWFGDILVIMCMDVSCDEFVKSVVEEIIVKEGKIDVFGKFRKKQNEWQFRNNELRCFRIF